MSIPDRPDPSLRPRPRLRRRWMVGAALFVAIQLVESWLPRGVFLPLFFFGVVSSVQVGRYIFGYLKDRVFWRVRYRVAGSLIFVGLIPLAVLAGLVFLVGYLLSGQLAAHYLRASLDDLAQELAWISVRVGERIDLPVAPARFAEVAAASAVRTDVGIRLLTRRGDEMRSTAAYDPASIFTGLGMPAVGAWLKDDSTHFEGLVRKDGRVFLVSVAALPKAPHQFLEVTSPIGPQVWERLRSWKSIDAQPQDEVRLASGRMFKPPIPGAMGATVPTVPTFEAPPRIDDPRWMVSWGTFLQATNYTTGEREPASFVVLRVPLEVLSKEYLTVDRNQARFVQGLVFILVGVFALVELISAAIGITISRRITQSVHDLHRGTTALRDGDLQHRIPVRKDDQLGELARSFNRMGDSIARLLEEVTEKKRLEHEIEIARRVQTSLFPKRLPCPQGLTVFGGCEPARVVSGDYYDFVFEDDTRLQIVVGDISGKGISAALLMANLQGAMRNQLASHRHAGPGTEDELASIMTGLNAHLFRNSPPEKYATMFVGDYDTATRRLAYCNAGHLPPLAVRGSAVKRLDAGGTVVGLFETATYEPATVELSAGTVLVVYTDGVTEATNDAGDEFGEDRLIAAVSGATLDTPESIYRRVLGELRAWQGDQKQQDDITLIVGRVA